MCGIFGIIGPSSETRIRVLRNMSDELVHRGPDSNGFYESDSAALGIRRLSIIDVDGGDQPVFDESGEIAVVFNGEIYNFRQLRKDLISKGHKMASRSDSECIPHLYEEYGAGFITRLRGMFAIALWDSRRNRLLLARDRLGKKPLYYRHDASGLAFASELKALLVDPATSRSVDETAISHYLTFQYIPAPMTALKAVRKLEPAQLLLFEQGECKTSRYWHLEYGSRDTATLPSQQDLAEELRERLLECVQARLVSERPLGAFLSGGLDSSAIVAAMSRVATGPVKTFSVGFEQSSHNELPYARRVAGLYGTDHNELIMPTDVAQTLPRLARAFDEPFADSSAIPSYWLAEMTSKHVVVALNGDGGDEALGGYLRYPRFLRMPQGRLPNALVAALRLGAGALAPLGSRVRLLRRASTAATLMAATHPATRYARFLSYFKPEEKMQLLSEDFVSRIDGNGSYSIVQEVWDAHDSADRANRLLAVDTHTYLPGDLLPKVDITTMAFSLEARSPFLDHTFVEWAASLPGPLKVGRRATKHLLRLALEPWLPSEIIQRRKMGFGVPLAQWLRGPLKELLFDMLTDGTARGRGWFRPGRVDRLLADHMAKQDRATHLYALLMLELWHREVLDATHARAS